MTNVTLERLIESEIRRSPPLRKGDPAFQAYALLHYGYTLLALGSCGLAFSRGRAHMGAVELALALLVAGKPSWGGAAYGGWFVAAAAAQLSLGAGVADAALAQAGLALGAFALSRLATQAGR